MSRGKADEQLRLSADLALPLDLVTEATAIVATRGAGKSSASAVVVEDGCLHDGPIRVWLPELDVWVTPDPQIGPQTYPNHDRVEAEWRILTVHHLDGDKANCRWWNLAALCQRCHLEIQAKVVMDQVYPHEHSEWFRPYAAGYYAFVYLGEDLPRDEAVSRMSELLALERTPS